MVETRSQLTTTIKARGGKLLTGGEDFATYEFRTEDALEDFREEVKLPWASMHTAGACLSVFFGIPND